MNPLEHKLVKSPSVPTLPMVAQKLLQLLNRRDVELSQLADLISVDPGLTLKVVRLINSPLYGIVREITSLRDAVIYLGMNAVRSVALSFSFLSAFPAGEKSGDRLNGLWRTSLMNALAARRLAAELGGWDVEEAFLAGLVADVGTLLMYRAVPEYPELVNRFYGGEADLLELEQQHLETTHPVLGSFLLEAWKFPRHLIELVKFHHDPTLVESNSEMEQRARVLYAAWLCARALTVSGFTDKISSLEHRVSGVLGIPVVVARGITAELPTELRETAAVFEVPVDEQRSYDELLDEANQTLSRLALEADQSARDLAGALAVGRTAFRQISNPGAEPGNLDNETGLLSRPAFDTLLEALHRRAREIHRPIGLMVFQIENLKSILEHNGHEVALEVLAKIGERVPRLIRQSDYCARLSDDQIAVLAPGCSAPDLLNAGERVRFGFEDGSLSTTAGPVSCQVVVGLASTTPHKDAIDPQTLVGFATSALDRAKLTPERLVLGG